MKFHTSDASNSPNAQYLLNLHNIFQVSKSCQCCSCLWAIWYRKKIACKTFMNANRWKINVMHKKFYLVHALCIRRHPNSREASKDYYLSFCYMKHWNSGWSICMQASPEEPFMISCLLFPASEFFIPNRRI